MSDNKLKIALLLFSLAAFMSHGCKESSVDARSLADALSEEFTDGLEFKDGETKSEDIPDEGSSTLKPFHIQAPHLFGPPDLGFGQDMIEYDTWFQVIMNSNDDLQTAGVTGAVAQIFQANKDDFSSRYLQIIPSDPDTALVGSQLIMEARVHYIPRLAGNSFIVRMAFLFADGSRSKFTEWKLVTYPMNSDSTVVPMCTCESAQLEFQDRSACRATQKFDSLFIEFDDPQMGPCSIWHSLFDSMESPDSPHPEFPSGTFFYPPASWGKGEDDATFEEAKACTVELWCP